MQMDSEKSNSRDTLLSLDGQPSRSRTKNPGWKHVLVLCILALFSFRGVSYLRSDLLPDLFGGVTSKSYKNRALKILKKHPLIDGHNDLAIAVRAAYGNHIYGKNFTEPFEHGGMLGNVDLPRIDAGQYGGAFWSAFWLCPADPFNFSNEAYEPIVRATMYQVDLLHRLSAAYPKYFAPTASSAVALAAFKKHRQLISPLALEGLHQIGNSFANLRLFYDLGVRYVTLNWNCHNIYSDAAVITFSNRSSVKSTPYWGGVSAKGRDMIREMNRVGMIVDLSHVSADTMRDVLVGEHSSAFPVTPSAADEDDWTGSLAPPIFSHSSAHALCPHPRNVPDDILPLVKRRNSVVMVNFSPDFVACHYPADADLSTDLPVTDAEEATLEKVADHIMHIGEAIGFDHVGIGSDFDGIETTPAGLEGVDKMPGLVAELLARGVSEKDVVGIVGGNVLRVWGEVERVSKKLQKSGLLPAEDDLKPLIPAQ